MKKLHIVHTNDFHSRFDKMARFHTFLQDKKARWKENEEEFLLFDIGDHMDRFALITEGTDGYVNRRIMETTGYDAITLGNNELLTFSPGDLERNYTDTDFSVICCNLKEEETGELPPWLLSSLVFERSGIRIGVTALTVPYPIVHQKMGWQVEAFLPALKREIQHLKEKSDVVLLLSHLGLPNDRQIAETFSDVDVIMGGHTHHLLEEAMMIEDTLVAAAGKHGEAVGIVTLVLNDEGRVSEKYGYTVELAPYDSSETIKMLLDEYQEQANERLSKPIATISKSLEVSWENESAFANFLADSLQDYLKLDCAVVNSGLILQSLRKGVIDQKTLHQLCPHPINPIWMKLRGEDLRISLEESLIEEYHYKPIQGFGFRGVSLGNLAVSGMQIYWDPSKPPMERVISIKIGGEELEEQKWYDVATIDMFSFGIGYQSLGKGKVVEYYLPYFLRHILANHFQKEDSLIKCYQDRWYSISS